ncbi:MAG: FAD-dependent oxidoreductase [Chthoniobacteraceae bacterium]
MAGSIVIVGAGEFGLTAALELRARGWSVTVLDQGSIPHPDAASTDVNKVVRSDYGADAIYTEMGEAAIAGWHRWNEIFGTPLYHEDGFLVMTTEAMKPGAFEHESFAFQSARGHTLPRRGSKDLRREHPLWNSDRYVDGYLNPLGGWAESARTIAVLAEHARTLGVAIVEQAAFAALNDHCVRNRDGRQWHADIVLMATGAWTPALLPHLHDAMWSTGQTMMQFQPDDPARFRAPSFPVWAADIGRTGWYGFPANADGIVKVANHGVGVPVNPTEARVVPADAEQVFRRFLRGTFPALADAPLAASRLCLYCDTFDGDFWIDHDSTYAGLVVAAGDSGHAFKFAPVLGGIIADVVEGKANRWAQRFRSRPRSAAAREGARASAESDSTSEDHDH